MLAQLSKFATLRQLSHFWKSWAELKALSKKLSSLSSANLQLWVSRATFENASAQAELKRSENFQFWQIPLFSDCDDQLSEIGLVLEFLLPFGNYNLTITNFNDTANDIQFVFDKHVLALSALTSKYVRHCCSHQQSLLDLSAILELFRICTSDLFNLTNPPGRNSPFTRRKHLD